MFYKGIYIMEPYGVETEIERLRLKVATIPWIEIAYGRAFRQKKVETVTGSNKQRTYFIAQVYGLNRETISVMPNDRLKGSCFFYVNDPIQNDKYSSFQLNSYTARVNIVVWANLDKIDLADKTRYTSALIKDVVDKIRATPSFKIDRIYESWENILSNYTITDQYTNYTQMPYTGFRIEMTAYFNEGNKVC